MNQTPPRSGPAQVQRCQIDRVAPGIRFPLPLRAASATRPLRSSTRPATSPSSQASRDNLPLCVHIWAGSPQDLKLVALEKGRRPSKYQAPSSQTCIRRCSMTPESSPSRPNATDGATRRPGRLWRRNRPACRRPPARHRPRHAPGQRLCARRVSRVAPSPVARPSRPRPRRQRPLRSFRRRPGTRPGQQRRNLARIDAGKTLQLLVREAEPAPGVRACAMLSRPLR